MLSAGPPRLFPGRQERSAADRVRAAVRSRPMAGRDRGFQGQYCRPVHGGCADRQVASAWVVLVGDRGMLLVSAKTSSLRDSIGSAPCARPGSVLWSPTARCNPPLSWPRSRNFTPESDSWSAATPCWRKSGRVSAKIWLQRLRSKQRRKRQNGTVGEKNISERVGRAVYKMKKHLEIAADTFSWRRNDDSIAAEAALDGFYVPACRRNSSTLARPLPPTKISVLARSAPLIDLNVRPHRLESRVRAHLLLCMLAYNATCASSLHQC